MQATKAKGKGKKRAPSPVASDSDDAASSAPSTPRTPAKRRSTTRRAAAAAPTQDDAVVDLTRSPPRKKKKKKAGKDNEADAVVVGTAGHAFSDERRAARDRAKKREAPEARWPTREEHEGGEGALVALGGGGSARGAWNARWPHMGGKGKERAVDEDPGAGAGSNFLEDMRRALFDPLQPSSSGAAPPTPTFSRRAHSSAPNLLPPFAPHPLLDRLAAPFRSPSSFPSAFARPTDPARVPSEDDAKLWSVKYSPQSADEVLGEVSGQSALWLREWLEELKVQSAAGDADAARRRRPVARGSLKKKKKAKRRKPLDDFIASSDGDDDDLVGGVPSSSYDALGSGFSDDNEDDDLLLPSGSASSRRAGSVFPTLTNLILLHGPHGTGKSAAVHAVARELEYEVFEVFPGMGRRGAKDLERYVGDVGRNHVVLGGSPRKGGNVAAMFQRMQAKAETGASGAKGTEKAVNGGADDARKAGDTDKGPTQSLILVDEVDVLFKGEEDFWQGLIALAQQSRRPIVMTCTDPSLVPFDDLGLQQVVFSPSAPPVNFLSFAAPSPDLAVPYLQLVALREGHILSASTVASLYSRFSPSRPYPAWLTQQQPGERPLPHPLSSMPLPSDDLRKALMQLQFECGWGLPGRAEPAGSHGAPGEPETMWCEGALRVPPDAEDVDVPVAATSASSGTPSLTKNGASVGVDALERATQAADALSFADAHVSRRIAVLLEDEETGRFTTAADAEESFPVLSFSVREETQRLPFIGAEPDMARAIEQLATRLWGDAARFGAREDEELESKRSELTFRLAQLVHSGGERALLQPPFDPVLPNAAVTTDYRPYLRAITLADDARLAASALATASATDEGGPSEVHAYGMAAALAAGAGPGGARKTRKSARQKAQQGKPMYERVLGWKSEVEAGWLRASGFEVPGQ
ncbi:hypothetical protein DMC30DRAFT_388948 [Rhodotorula diobovata]|uniref:AAA+ ATPase domain-containing protein n=1 Tax=Rhodotorula diobovata TaxID=5288 RepID=A0A5C5G3X1_9BASI|nr:hypothetical protein DMC30DRAFT_388948 [Rhodotorula diobovata]